MESGKAEGERPLMLAGEGAAGKVGEADDEYKESRKEFLAALRCFKH